MSPSTTAASPSLGLPIVINAKMKPRISHILLLSLIALTSCGGDPQLVKKRQEQNHEIARLEGELEMLQENLRRFPADCTTELDQMKETVKKQIEELEELENQMQQMEQKTRKAQEELERYQKNYPISDPQ